MKNEEYPYSLQRILYTLPLWCGVWVLIHSLVLHRLGLSWQLAFFDGLLFNVFVSLACFVAIVIYRYYQPGGGNRLYRFVFATGITLLCCNGFEYTMQYFFNQDLEYLNFIQKSMPLRFVISFLMLSFVTVLNWMWSTVQSQQKQGLRKNEAEQLIKEAELVKLRQQLQPHFLFNSLNSINALIVTQPLEARKMIQQLSDFLRGTLKKDEQKLVSLGEEWEHLKLYLDIERVRFGDRLNLNTQLSEQALEAKLPPLILQPLVENAIKFGLYGTTDIVRVNVIAQYSDAMLHVEITNPFDPETQHSEKGTGFGLDSVQRRLFLLFSRSDLLMVKKEHHTFITILKIPQNIRV